jgi:ribosomal-protein-alanine N-acetyltransferase
VLSVNLHPFPVLETERLVLRQVETGDVEQVFILRSDPQVLKYIDREPCESLDEANEHITKLYTLWNENEGIAWAITLKNDGHLIGSLGFFNLKKEHYRAEFGYSLHPSFQGKGIMLEAARKVIDYAFNQMHLHSLEAIVNPENFASIKVLVRNNFVKEGYFKENYFFHGRFLDSAVYSLLATTFPGKQYA